MGRREEGEGSERGRTVATVAKVAKSLIDIASAISGVWSSALVWFGLGLTWFGCFVT